jgi:hypothetical protein
MAIKVKGARDVLGSLPKAPSRPTYDPVKQTQGYLRRLEGAGVDVDKAADPRNVVEKALNLRPNQNVLFDIFEVINRPQQAFFNSWKAIQEGQNVGEAFKRGITGEDYVLFKEILGNYGLDEESFATKALGFAGDVFLDPVNWALIPVTASIKGIDTAADAARIIKNSNLGDKVLEAAKTAKTLRLNSIDDIAKITQEGLQAKRLIELGDTTKKAEKALNRFNKLQDIVKTSIEGEKYLTRASALGIAGRGAKTGILKLAGVSDDVITKGLMSLDSLNGITFKDPKARTFKQLILDTGLDKKSYTVGYYSLKDSLGGMFDIASKLPDKVLATIRKSSGAESLTRQSLVNSNTKVKKLIQQAAESGVGGSTADDVGKNLLNLYEYVHRKVPSKLKKLTLEELVTSGAPMNDRVFKRLTKTLQKYGINLADDSIGKGVLKQGSGSLKRYTITKELSDEIAKLFAINPNLANTKFLKSTFYTREARELLEALMKDESFMKLFNEVVPEYEKLQKALSIFQKNAKLEKFTEAGYARHVYNQDFDALQKLGSEADAVLPGLANIPGEGIKYGNVKAIAERKWQMSALEANTIVKDNIMAKLSDPTIELSDKARQVLTDLSQKNLFVETIQASMDDWIAEIPKLVKNADVIDEILVKSIVSTAKDGTMTISPNDIIKINYTGAAEALPRGYVKIDIPELKKKLDELIKVIDSPEMEKLVKELAKGGTLENAGVAIDKHVYSMLNYINEPKELGYLMQGLNFVNNEFKKLKLLSAGFHVRNIIGNYTNAMLVGMPARKIPVYFKRADDVLRLGQKAADDLLALGGDLAKLTPKDRRAYKIYERFIGEGFGNISAEIYDITADMVSKSANPFTAKGLKEKYESVTKLNSNVNEFFDMRYRLGLYMYASETPAIMRNIGVDNAGDVVRRALFDPKATSRAERETIKRIVPFYTFAKKNLAYQMRNIFDNPVHYNRLQKSVRGLWDMEGISVDDIESYKKENFWVPIPGLTKDGKYTAIKTNLPIGDLAEWLDSPLVKGLSSVTPAVRAPFEVAANVQLFTGRPIQDFPGQKGYIFPNIPRNLEYALGQTGADIPFAAIRNALQTAGRIAGMGEEEVTFGAAIPTGFSEGDVERAQRSRDYDELSRIRDLFSYYKQELGTIPTISEIENRNKNQLNISSKMNGLLKTK